MTLPARCRVSSPPNIAASEAKRQQHLRDNITATAERYIGVCEWRTYRLEQLMYDVDLLLIYSIELWRYLYSE